MKCSGIRKFKLHIRNIFCPHWKVKSDTNVGTKDIVGDPAIDFSVPVRSSMIQIIAAMSSHGLQQKCFKYSINLILCWCLAHLEHVYIKQIPWQIENE